MAPKADKAKAAQKEKVAVDKTFGMKNKNKSKVVQKYIKSIHQNATGSSNRASQEEKREKDAKANDLQQKALMASLFNLKTDKKGKGYDPVAKKKKEAEEADAIAAGRKLSEEMLKTIIEGIANTIRLTNPKTGIRMSELGGHPIIQALKEKHVDVFRTIQLLLFIKAQEGKVFWLDDAESSNPMIRCQEDVDHEVAPDGRSLEEIIEERRRALTGPGTPITEETFQAWKKKKEEERLSKVESDRSAEAKKSGGKALHVMSGRDLFTYDASLFVDDEEAAGADEYDEREERLASESEKEEDDDDDDEADAEAKPEPSSSAAAGSGDVAINKDLFLQGGDDDLDDLDDLDDDDEDEKKA